jgi:hypothetical protein
MVLITFRIVEGKCPCIKGTPGKGIHPEGQKSDAGIVKCPDSQTSGFNKDRDRDKQPEEAACLV